MENIISGNATYYLEPNVDTDIIIPARFLKRTSLDNFQPFAFFERKYLPETICEPKMEAKDFVFSKPHLNPEFPPNHPNCIDATFLLTFNNFGCGSSREHAVYSLSNFRVIIGSAPHGKTAFADIFRDNCRQNLIWTPVISEENHSLLKKYLISNLLEGAASLKLNAIEKTLSTENNEINIPFNIPESHLQFFSNSEADPFKTAEKSISGDLQKIIAWEKENPSRLETFPSSK